MVPLDFFGCTQEQIVSCNWVEAFERYPSTGITVPDESALTSLNEALTGRAEIPHKRLTISPEPIYILGRTLTEAIRRADPEELKNAGARWAVLKPWSETDVNSMDLAGFLLDLRSLVSMPENANNSIFMWMGMA